MTPKEQFLKTPHAKGHADLVQSDQFREACNYAMLQFLENIRGGVEGASLLMEGGKLFREALETIATPNPEQPTLTTPKLRHDAYDARRR